MLPAVVGHVLVDLVGDDPQVVRLGDPDERGDLVARPDGPGRVRGRAHDDGLRAVGDRSLQPVRVERPPPAVAGQGDGHGADAVEPQDTGVVAVERLEQDHLVARLAQRQDRRDERARRPGGDDDGLGAVERDPVERPRLLGDRLAEQPDAVVGRVDGALAALERVDRRLDDGRGRGEVADPLPQVHPADAVHGERDGPDVGLAEGVGAGGEGLHQTAGKRATEERNHARRTGGACATYPGLYNSKFFSHLNYDLSIKFLDSLALSYSLFRDHSMCSRGKIGSPTPY